MLTPRCYIELVRLADRHGGGAAAVRALRRSWPSFGPADFEKYAEQVQLMDLGRGFYRAVRCEDWA